MLVESNIIEGPYLRDILQQPEALRQSLAGFEDGPEIRQLGRALDSGEFKRVVLTGMGSSLHALYPLHLALTNRGLPSLLVETSELIHYLADILTASTLVIAVSQSGQSAEIVRMLEMTQGAVPVIGVTNNANSVLAAKSQVYLQLRAGSESSVSCKTYVATLLALEWLGAALAGEDLAKTRRLLGEVIPTVDAYLSNWRAHVEDLCGLLAGVEQVFVTGRGPSIATARTGGLILKESTRLSAEGMSCAAFRHGPFEMLSPSVFVLIMAGDARSRDLNQRLALDVLAAGGKSGVVDMEADRPAFRIPEVPDSVRPVLEILPVQMISLALAARLGREAGRFELASKITSVE